MSGQHVNLFTAAREPQTLRTPRSAVMISDPPHPRHESRAASFFGAMAFLVVLILALTAVGALGGCDRPLTKAEVAKLVSYCRAHHETPIRYGTPSHRDVVYAVQCQVDQ